MITALSIQNFQSHKSSVLKFDKGVNVITGSSDSGKTAIIRALRWLVWNRPGGDNFRSSWGGDTVVIATTDDNVNISRSKGSAGNLYEINDDPLVGFGTNVPDEVQKVLGIDEINLQQQLDSPFLLSETPGNVAQYFNKIANLDKIDSTTSNINSAIRKINADIKYYQEQVNKYKQELQAYPDLDLIEHTLNRLERKEARLDDMNNQKYKIAQTIQKIQYLDLKIKDVGYIVQWESDVNKLLTSIDSEKQLNKEIDNLQDTLNELSRLQTEITEITAMVKTEGLVDTLLQKYTLLDQMGADADRLESCIDNLTYYDENLLKMQQNASKLEMQFKTNFPDVCPLCGTPKVKA